MTTTNRQSTVTLLRHRRRISRKTRPTIGRAKRLARLTTVKRLADEIHNLAAHAYLSAVALRSVIRVGEYQPHKAVAAAEIRLQCRHYVRQMRRHLQTAETKVNGELHILRDHLNSAETALKQVSDIYQAYNGKEQP